MLLLFRIRDSDNDSSDLERRSRKDKDGESSKSKKKHKKHKKNKKSKKNDADSKGGSSSSKKHKKHHKRAKSSDGNSTDSNTESATANKVKGDKIQSSRHDSEIKLPPQTTSTSTLNTKFTEIMKSNGHIVAAQVAAIPKTSHRNGAETSKKDMTAVVATATTTTTATAKIPTDPNKLVEFITKSLDPNTSTQVVSSASDSDTVRDVDSPDVAVIEEDDLNLEELMRQKALLQARLGGIVASDTESENSHKTPASHQNKPILIDDKTNTTINTNANANSNAKAKLKRIAEPVTDVILLDDSSNDASEKPSPPKKKVRSSRSRSRDRLHKERIAGNSRNNRDSRDNDKSAKARRSDADNQNRFKEDLRKEIDRDKERNRSSPKPSQRQGSFSQKPGTHSPNSRSRLSTSDKNKVPPSTSSSIREREVN